MYTVGILWNDITLPENYEAFLREPVAIQVAGYESPEYLARWSFPASDF